MPSGWYPPQGSPTSTSLVPFRLQAIRSAAITPATVHSVHNPDSPAGHALPQNGTATSSLCHRARGSSAIPWGQVCRGECRRKVLSQNGLVVGRMLAQFGRAAHRFALLGGKWLLIRRPHG
jgi:hypothetical protein